MATFPIATPIFFMEEIVLGKSGNEKTDRGLEDSLGRSRPRSVKPDGALGVFRPEPTRANRLYDSE